MTPLHRQDRSSGRAAEGDAGAIPSRGGRADVAIVAVVTADTSWPNCLRAVLAPLAVEVVEVSPGAATEETLERLGARVVLLGAGESAVHGVEIVGAARRRGVTVIVGSDRGLDDATLALLHAGAHDYVASDRVDRELAPRVAAALLEPDAASVRRRDRVLAAATRGLEAFASDRARAAEPALSEEDRQRIATLIRVAVQR